MRHIAIILTIITTLTACGAVASAANATSASAPASQPAVTGAGDQAAPDGGAMGTLGRAVAKLYLCFELVGTASVVLWLIVWLGLVFWSLRTRGMGACLAGSLLIGLVVVYGLMVPGAGEILAIPVWIAITAAMVIVVVWAFTRRQLPAAFALLLLAVGAFALGQWNSANVDNIREDRSAEIAAARQRQVNAQKVEARKLRSKAANIHFAEDDRGDSLDAAGYSEAELTKIESADPNAPTIVPAQVAGGEDVPDYKKRGKKKRDANQIDANAPGIDAVVAAAPDDSGPHYRLLPGPDYVLAGQLDMMNRFMVYLTLVTALLVAAAEYLRRFNRTFDSILPLPIAGRFVDTIWPKTHSVLIGGQPKQGAGQHEDGNQIARAYLETVVRKGESFILFANEDPWPSRDRLPRMPGLSGLWPMRKIVGQAGEPACDPTLALESAWYGRYGFVVLGGRVAGPVRDTLDEIIHLLGMRLRTKAAARRTVHIVWLLPEALPADVAEELIFLCHETNLKFVAVTGDPSSWPGEAFEEVRDATAEA